MSFDGARSRREVTTGLDPDRVVGEDENSVTVPVSIKVAVCPVCGRMELHSPWALVDHYHDQRLCPGMSPAILSYRIATDQTQAEPVGEAPEIPVFEGTRAALDALSVRKDS